MSGDVMRASVGFSSRRLLRPPLLCLRELKPSFISSLMPALLTTMKNAGELGSGDACLLSAVATLQKVVETLPHFLSPYLQGVLSQVSPRGHNMLLGGGGEGKNYKFGNFICSLCF